MAITGINNSSYTSYYASNYKNTVKKTDSEKDSTNTKDGNVTTSTVELKTSRPGVTKTEQSLYERERILCCVSGKIGKVIIDWNRNGK